MKSLNLAVSALFLAFIASPAFSYMITDTVNIDQKVRWETISYVHDLNDDNFVLGSAVSGTLSVEVYDKQHKWYETALFTVEGFDLDSGGFTFGTSFINGLEVKALSALNTDGLLNVSILAFGNFWIGDSVLSVITEVPEPATFALLLIGLCSLVFARRRTQFQA